MSAKLSSLYDEAFAALGRAVEVDETFAKGRQLEEEGRMDEEDRSRVVLLYEEALDLFQQCFDMESDPTKRSVVASELRTYGRRLGALKTQTGDRRWAAAKALDAAKSKAFPRKGDQDVADMYLGAVEAYLSAIKLQDPECAENATLRSRVAHILDRVESIKKHDPPPAPHEKRHSLTCGSQNSASTCLDVQDLPLPPTSDLSCFPSAPSATFSSSHCVRGSSSSNGSGPPRDDTTSYLTPAEVEVLRRSSVIKGRTFLPWMEGEESREQFHYVKPFADPDGLLSLSPKQAAHLGGWKRPHEFIRGRPGSDQGPRMIGSVTPHSIMQEQVSDCSFVASLCICAAFEQRFQTQLITKIIYPQDARGRPMYNPSGKYLVKLWANGCVRKVVVDDFLPVDRHGNLLCSSSSDRTELWVSIVEKAAMKLLGGSYDFPGSNSGIDVYMLTGWVPEQIFWREEDQVDLNSVKRTGAAQKESSERARGGTGGDRPPLILDHRQPAERAWARLSSASALGDCLTTIATTPMDPEVAERLGLIPSHAYAVLSVREVLGGRRFLLVKNPWRRKSWRGPYCPADTARWTPELCEALGYAPLQAQKHDDGVCWIAWEDVRRYFSSIFLNWRPSLFAFRTTHHALWRKEQGPPNDLFTYGQNPQYSLRMDRSKSRAPGSTNAGTACSSVWLLLSRHTRQTSDRHGMDSSGGSRSCHEDFLTLHVYKSRVTGGGPRRVIYPSDDCVVRGLYSNNPHNLVRFDVDKGDPGAYVLVLSQYEKRRDVRFSLSVLSTGPFVLQELPALPAVVAKMEGTWGPETAGGRLGLATFLLNPQFAIAVKKPCAVHVELLAPKEYFVSFSLIGGARGGKRLDSILQGEEVLTSGSYRQGFCAASTSDSPGPAALLRPGIYTLVASTYDAGLRGNFVINFHSAVDEGSLQASVLLPEGEGFVRHELGGAWKGELTGGCSPPGYAARNPTYVLACTERTRVFMRLVAHENEPINVTLFQLPSASSGGAAGSSELPVLSTFPGCPSTIATSHNAVFTASRCGVTTPVADLTTGTYAVVLACYDANVEAAFTLTVFTSSKGMRLRQIL